MAMITQLKTKSPLQNFTYLIEHSPGKVWCIDPFDGEEVQAFIKSKNLELEVIINTHEHWDHHQGNAYLKNKFNCEVWAHELATAKIPKMNRVLKGGEILKLSNQKIIEILDTPGHTFAHLCLLLKEDNRPQSIFTGDTFFNAGVGNCRNGGDPKVLFQTIEKYFQVLPDQVVVYPGHDYLMNNLRFTLSIDKVNAKAQEWLSNPLPQTTIKDEKGFNLFLRLDEENLKKALQIDSTNREQVFLELRSRRDRW